MTVLHDLTALGQAAAIRRREISPVELVEHYLARIDELNAPVGAYITVTAALARARAADAERTVVTADDPDALPPLLGVPVAVKDLTMVADVRCTLGSAAYDDFVAPLDDHVVTLLRQAGAVILGKANTPEFGLPAYTENEVAPPARTPWDLGRSAGGSSGGSAAAVAAGLAAVAQGNDGGGSVRTPASVCGLVGLKPARGRISNGPLLGEVNGNPCHGPIARTVEDAAALLDVMAVPMPGDPHWAPPLPPGESFLAWSRRDPGPLRIGRFLTPVLAETPIDPACVAAYDAASKLVESLGHTVEDVPAPFGPESVPAFEKVWSVGAQGVPVAPERESRLLPLTRWLRERGSAVSGYEFANALATMQRLARSAITSWISYDALLTPTLSAPPALVGGQRNDTDPAADFEAQKRFNPFSAAYNVTGQPAITLPLAWTEDGLPVGVMLAGRPAGEAALLSLAGQIERAAPWRDRRPPCW